MQTVCMVKSHAVLSGIRSGLTIRSMSASVKIKPPTKRAPPSVPRPSSSVILVSSDNHVLLLHRIKTSTSFPAAHVFPGGNVSSFHDGELPEPESPARHNDSVIYRLAAIRETFEESGILLARDKVDGNLLQVHDEEREYGRRQVHSSQVSFKTWVLQHGGALDTDGLIPFTRWITPTNIPKRFTTQMYLYFLPLDNGQSGFGKDSSARMVPKPTHDGGKEHTAARFLPPAEWLQLAREDQIIMFPPQFFLLHMIAQFLTPRTSSSTQNQIADASDREDQRRKLQDFLKTGDPPWGAKVISPTALPPANGQRRPDGRTVLGLDKPGPGLQGKRFGDHEHVVLVDFKKEGPRRLEVRSRKEVLEEGRQEKL